MISPDPEIDRHRCTINVGQDCAGHWLVQDSSGTLEGRFVSFSSAMAFARSEGRSLPNSAIVLAADPLVPIVSFAPVQPWETAPRYRAAA